MPSSPGPPDYKRVPQRFFYRGISLLPQDALPDGKHAYALNIRSHQEGTFEPRYGQSLVTDAALPAPVHSLFRLNDPTPFAAAVPAQRFAGSATVLYAAIPSSGTYAAVDTGYSGDPLTALTAAPFASTRPYLYVADADRMRKFDSNLAVFPWGLPQPLVAPNALLAQPQTTFLQSVDEGTGTTNWTGYGAVTYTGSGTPGAPVPVVSRVNTTITQLVYDEDGATLGMASVAAASMDNLVPGTTVEIGSAAETVIVQEVLPAIATTTIAAIIYDSGTTGLCTIQPTGSLAAGQIELPETSQINRRYTDLDQPAPPPVTLTRTVDFPVNALVVLGGTEVVRILSIAVGPDGVQSFRCATTGTYTAGATLDGLACIRAFATTLWAIGDPITASALELSINAADSPAEPTVGGIQAPLIGFRNWNLVGDRATQPEDIIRFGIKVSLLPFVQSVRLVLDVGGGTTAFLQEYYFYEWRAADLVTAIQSASEVVTGTVKDAQNTGVTQGQYDGMYRDQYGQMSSTPVVVDLGNGLSAYRRTLTEMTPAGRQNLDRTVRQRAELARIAPVATGGAISRQLALGNDAWITLECRVGDLIRVGTNQSLTLREMFNACIYLQTEGTTDPITVSFSDCYLTGGYGPDVSTTLPPYVYRYSFRSTITGERSNLSPPMRAGVLPHRGRVVVTAPPCTSANQCDVVDFWRFGGALARWTYVGTTPNDTGASPSGIIYTDDLADGRIDGGQPPWSDRFQPWPVSDLPRMGTCNVAGTRVQWVSGDDFKTQWAPNSAIIINGIATQLYTNPYSSTQLDVVDNVGSGTNVPFSLPFPTRLAQELPVVFGGAIGSSWFNFGVGDPIDPGSVHWTHANDPDAASDAFTLVVTSASEPLQNGWLDDGVPYVFSTDDLYRLRPSDGPSQFIAEGTNCGRGLWSRWAFAVDPNGGCFFLAKDGIYHVAGGGAAECLTIPDLQPLFPQEGTVAEAIRGLYPVDLTATNVLKLTVVGQYLYFDYQDTQGNLRTLVYEPKFNRWTPDQYAVGLTARESETGPQVQTHLMGGSDGNIRQYNADRIGDVDANIQWALWTPWAGGDDARMYKQWGDAILDFNPAGSVDGINVTPVVDNGNMLLAPQIVGVGGTVRDTYTIEVGAVPGSNLGYGVVSRNFGLQITGNCQVCNDQRPLFYLWEAAGIGKGTGVGYRATDWDDLGYKGSKFVQGIVIRANTFGIDKSITIQYDGPNAAPQTALTLTINHDGEQTKAYPLTTDGWVPFVAELVRLKGADPVEWTLLDWRFVWEPAPESVTQYETQYTTFDYPGFLAVYDGIVAYQSTATVIWAVEYQDGAVESHMLAATGDNYARVRQICNANKGKAVRFRWTSAEPFRLFKRDCSVRVQPWGVGGYQLQQPFGGPSRVDGAEI